MPAIVKLSLEALAEAIASLDLEEKRQLQEMIEQQIFEDEEQIDDFPTFHYAPSGNLPSRVFFYPCNEWIQRLSDLRLVYSTKMIPAASSVNVSSVLRRSSIALHFVSNSRFTFLSSPWVAGSIRSLPDC